MCIYIYIYVYNAYYAYYASVKPLGGNGSLDDFDSGLSVRSLKGKADYVCV